MTHLSQNLTLRTAPDSAASSNELRRTAPVKAADARTTEREPAARVEISAAAQARSAEQEAKVEAPEPVNKTAEGRRVTDPKFKQVLWSEEVWQKHPSGTSPEQPDDEEKEDVAEPTTDNKSQAFSRLRFAQAHAQSGAART